MCILTSRLTSLPFRCMQGWATQHLPAAGRAPEGASMAPLLDALIKHIPPPAESVEDPFSFLVGSIGRGE